jgi:hypothetical protein
MVFTPEQRYLCLVFAKGTKIKMDRGCIQFIFKKSEKDSQMLLLLLNNFQLLEPYGQPVSGK